MNDSSEHWHRLAGKITFRVNTAIVQGIAGPWLIFGGALVMISGIISRSMEFARTPAIVAIALGLSLLLVATVAIVRCRGRLIGRHEALVRLDDVLRLDNALSTAAAGVGRWPDYRRLADHQLRLNWRRTLFPILAAGALITAGIFAPVPGVSSASKPMAPPRSHEEIAAAITRLEEVEAVKKEDLAELKKRLDEIRGEPSDEWYSHSSLEAADHLMAGMQEQLRELSRHLSQAQSSLGELNAGVEAMSSAEQQRLAQEFKSALHGLKRASPGLNEKLMSALSKVDPSNLKSLSKGDLERMLEGMKAAESACKNCSGGKPGGKTGTGGDAQSELNNLLGDGEKQRTGTGPGPEDSEPGRGGIQRGPGVAPLPLSDSPTDLATQNPESLKTGDLTRTRPGDRIGTADTEHRLDKTPVGPQASGAAGSKGHGGDAVWRDALMPREKAVLQKYFK